MILPAVPKKKKGSGSSGKGGRSGGSSNIKRSTLKTCIDKIEPTSLIMWERVATEYQNKSGESYIRDVKTLKRTWYDMCNKNKIPTGKAGSKKEFILQCQRIERRIRDNIDMLAVGHSESESESGSQYSRDLLAPRDTYNHNEDDNDRNSDDDNDNDFQVVHQDTLIEEFNDENDDDIDDNENESNHRVSSRTAFKEKSKNIKHSGPNKKRKNLGTDIVNVLHKSIQQESINSSNQLVMMMMNQQQQNQQMMMSMMMQMVQNNRPPTPLTSGSISAPSTSSSSSSNSSRTTLPSSFLQQQDTDNN